MPISLRQRLARFFNPSTGLPWRAFWVALLVRLAYMTLAHTWKIHGQENFAFGYEAGRIAQALVTGYGYADPFANVWMRHTGPTAWLPPVYPLVLAAIFKVFGVYSRLSAWMILAFNCLCSALVAPAIWELGMRFNGRRNALCATWIWTLYPAFLQYAVKWVWEMSLTAALFAWVLVVAMRLRERASSSANLALWAVFGLLWGLIALSNSSLLAALPAIGLWVLGARFGRRSVLSAALSGAVCLAVIAPWTLRNERVFNAFVPLRGNFGVELYLGNGPNASGYLMEYDHPYQAPDQLKLYAQMGEVAYERQRGQMAKAIIVRNPGLFVRNTLKRIYFFWWSVPHAQDPRWWLEPPRVLDYGFISLAGLMGLGLALWRRKPGAWLFAWAFLLLPLPYYVVTVHARFRHPLEPLCCILGVYLFECAERKKGSDLSATKAQA
jgi:4-amino-4-deoxy-L-arabinose transferase-like glycosyltransferase